MTRHGPQARIAGLQGFQGNRQLAPRGPGVKFYLHLALNSLQSVPRRAQLPHPPRRS